MITKYLEFTNRMAKIELENQLNNLLNKFDFQTEKDFKLVVFLGLLGDFDSFEYAINLNKILELGNLKKLDILFIAIGNEIGKKKFCDYTKFPAKYLKVVDNNDLHNLIGASKGLQIGLGGWVNMILMLMGIGSSKTIFEVIRGYTGDKESNQIYCDEDQIDLFDFLKFSGKLFGNTFGDNYLRPFELATFRLKNMIEIFQNWNDYMIDTKYLPQRSCTFILDQNNKIIYEYFSKDILNYSYNMKSPLNFLSNYINE